MGRKTACEGEGKGKRLNADLYGAVSCKCSVDLGYVEVNGTCYHEHFRGPCENGQRLQGQTHTGEWECVQDDCSQGEASITILVFTNKKWIRCTVCKLAAYISLWALNFMILGL